MSNKKTITIAAPVFNEEKIIREFISEIETILLPYCSRYNFNFLLINDGSSDGTLEILHGISSRFEIRVISFTRNFGHPAACWACLCHAEGDALVLMDSDLQDDPQAIPLFIEKWEKGFDVVYAVRKSRKESSAKRFLFSSFYRLFQYISEIDAPLDSGNFSLMDRKVVDRIKNIPQKNRYLAGMRAYVGFRQTGIPVHRRIRHDNVSRVGMKGLFRLAFNAFFSFSYLPIRVFNIFGGIALVISVFIAGYALTAKLLLGTSIQAWTSQIITTAFFGGINLLGIGVVGEYVARIYDQVKGYPEYMIDHEFSSQAERRLDTGSIISIRPSKTA